MAAEGEYPRGTKSKVFLGGSGRIPTFAPRRMIGREPNRFPLLFLGTMEILQQIRHWIEERLQEEAYAPYFIIEVRLAGTRKIEVFLDGDQGIDLDTCRDFSRYLEGLLDAGGQMGEDYTLEVSSPGATRPLILPRQYPKHVGRTLEVRRSDGSKLEGRLTEAGAETFALEVVTGKGRNKEVNIIPIPYEEVAECRVKISFRA